MCVVNGEVKRREVGVSASVRDDVTLVVVAVL